MRKLLFIIVFLITLISCKKENETGKVITYNLSGWAQKGPFLAGSDVTIIELDNQLNPTGKVFFSTIEDNSGFFAFPDVEFESEYIQLKVEGLYYNEIFGGINMMSEIILQSIVDISDNSLINVNLITHLVHARGMQLFNNGMSFANAFDKAYEELMSVFYIEKSGIAKPENLDLTAQNSDGGVLLLVSSIIQSNIASGMTFPEFLSSLTNDFKDNGSIDNEIIQKTLGTSGLVLNLQDVRQNLISRYSEIGKAIDPYAGTLFLKNFNKNNIFPTIFDGFFPSSVGPYLNLINKGDTVYIDKNQQYSLAINRISGSGISSIQVAITSNSGIYTTSEADWYIEGNKKILLMTMDNSSSSIPIEFSDTGNLKIELGVVTSSSGMVKYPDIVVIWGL